MAGSRTEVAAEAIDAKGLSGRSGERSSGLVAAVVAVLRGASRRLSIRGLLAGLLSARLGELFMSLFMWGNVLPGVKNYTLARGNTLVEDWVEAGELIYALERGK